ncbi:MAG: cell division protein FtsX [Massilia sp.]|nr:cell division protein FtsX [Massilia sp.]
MRLRHFRAGWRALVKEPAYSSVVVGALAVGVAACLLLLGLVRYSWDYNAGVPDVQHVFVVKQRLNSAPAAPWYDQAPLLLRPAALQLPGVLDATSYLPSRPQEQSDGKLIVRVNDGLQQLQSLTVLPGFADMLGLQAVQGSLKAALDQPESIAITEAAAMRLFGTIDGLGRTIRIEGKLLRAAAILRSTAANTTLPFEALLGVNSVLVEKEVRQQMLTGEQGWSGKVLIRVRPGASLAAITDGLQQAVDRSPSIQKIEPEVRTRLGKRKPMDIALSPLRYAYFDHEVAGNFIAAPGERANPLVVAGLGAVGMLILALAALNYVNLATVRVLQRQVDVAMRKVLGAGVAQIVLHFLAESMVVAGVATGLGLLLAWLALPVFSTLMNRDLTGMLSPANIGAALAIGAVLGVVTAAYPAWVAIRVRPNQVLAGRPGSETTGGRLLRRGLTVLQMSSAMGLASVTLAVAWQTGFAMRASPGFDPAPLVIVELPEMVRYSKPARGLVAALSAQPGVAGIAISEDSVAGNNGSWSRVMQRPGGTGAGMDMKSVSTNFFEQYRIRPAAGRLFDAAVDKEDDAVPVVINAVAASELGFGTLDAAVGQAVTYTAFDGKIVHKRIVGIAPELRFRSLRETTRATAWELSTDGNTLSIRTTDAPARIEAVVQALWPRYFPESIPRIRQAKAIFAANYAEEVRVAKLLAVATGIALLIAAVGIYVLSAHTVQRRAREIALRKLHGARPVDVGLLVVREIGGLVAVAAIIGLPLAALAIERYLAIYVVRAPIGYWTLVFALVSTVAIALISVARHAWLAMRMMASDALRV